MKIEYVKYILILIFVCVVVYFVKDYQEKNMFKKNAIENQSQMEKLDSLRVAYIINTDRQMLDYVKSNKALAEALKAQGVKLDRVTSIMNHVLKYRDTTIVQTDLSVVLDAINTQKDISYPVKDSTKCLVIKGTVDFVGGQLSLNITDRKFNSNTTAVAFWERNLWTIPIFKIKTRFLGKKQGTVRLIDECGESKIINISTNGK